MKKGRIIGVPDSLASLGWPIRGTKKLLWEENSKLKKVVVKKTCLIGSNKKNDIALAHPEISEYHCRIDMAGGAVPILSATGQKLPKVNGKSVTQAHLSAYDIISIGPFQLLFWVRGTVKKEVKKTALCTYLLSTLSFAYSCRKMLLPPYNEEQFSMNWMRKMMIWTWRCTRIQFVV